MPQLEVAGIQTHYAEHGDGMPFVLVHGAGANGNYWKLLAKDLTARFGNPRILAPDLFGHGKTPPWPSSSQLQCQYEYAHDVELLARLTEKLRTPFDLIGHSSGGAICLEFARQHPERVRKLVLAEPMLPGILATEDPTSFAEVETAYQGAHDAVRDGHAASAAERLFEYILGNGEWQLLASGVRSWMVDNVACTLAAHSRASLALRPRLADYRELAGPVLLLAGERTRAPFARICELLAATISRAQLKILRGANHNAPLTHPADFHAAVLDFW